MAPRPVVLDAAGTLLELRHRVGETYAGLARQVGVEVDSEAVEEAFRGAFGAAPPLAFGGLERDLRRVAERDWWRRIVRESVTAAGAPADLPSERLFDLAWEWFAAPAAWRVPEDVRPGLRALRRSGHPLAVLSNWDGRLAGLLKGVGLRGYFARVLVSADLPAAKPSPDAFRAAARALAGLGSGIPIMVGDRVDHDVGPALTAGWDAIWLDRGGRGGTPGGASRVSTLRAVALDPLCRDS